MTSIPYLLGASSTYRKSPVLTGSLLYFYSLTLELKLLLSIFYCYPAAYWLDVVELSSNMEGSWLKRVEVRG